MITEEKELKKCKIQKIIYDKDGYIIAQSDDTIIKGYGRISKGVEYNFWGSDVEKENSKYFYFYSYMPSMYFYCKNIIYDKNFLYSIYINPPFKLDYKTIDKIYSKYENYSIDILQRNPYAIINYYEDITFQKADIMNKNSYIRIKVILIEYLKYYCVKYHVYYVKKEDFFTFITKHTKSGISSRELFLFLNLLQINKDIYINNDMIYLIDKDLNMVSLMSFPFNFTEEESIYILNKLGNDAEDIIYENPYQYIHEINGFNFKKAEIINNFSYKRLKFLILSIIDNISNSSGDIFIPSMDIENQFYSYLNMDEKFIFQRIFNKMKENKELLLKTNNVCSLSNYNKEKSIAKNIIRLLNMGVSIEANNIKEDITYTENKFNIVYAPEQKEALELSFLYNVLIVTGGPGTGKSTVIKGIREILIKNNPNINIQMCAPTGRAAERMTETTGAESQTIHRLLLYGKNNEFKKCSSNQLDCDVIICDESSMIDDNLMSNLLDAVNNKTKIIFIGDINQLAPVGPGYPFKDMIESEIIPYIKLNRVFRQGEDSSIKINAQNIIDGVTTLFVDKNFKIISDFKNIEEVIVSNFVNMLTSENFNIYNVQILSPMRKGISGTDNLNKVIQNTINPVSENVYERIFYDRINNCELKFRTSDKVMQIINNYSKSIFNGDIGIITSITDAHLIVKFQNGREITYFNDEVVDNLILAYAITIHKSQGSEFKSVIVVDANEQKCMLQRYLLYTAVTRAKENLVLIGETKAINTAINNTDGNKRNTELNNLLKKYYIEYRKTITENNSNIFKKVIQRLCKIFKK